MGRRRLPTTRAVGGATMSATHYSDRQTGVELADRLGLDLNRREGHDLAGPCVSCQSSDAFRLHQQSGVAHCFSCHGKWSPFQLAETVLKDRETARALMIELGIFSASGSNGSQHSICPLLAIAQQKS